MEEEKRGFGRHTIICGILIGFAFVMITGFLVFSMYSYSRQKTAAVGATQQNTSAYVSQTNDTRASGFF